MSVHSSVALAAAALIGIGLMLPLTGCESLHAYDGAQRPRRELAHIVGNNRLSGSLPVVLSLRRIDERELGLRFSGVYVPAGAYDLLIDCTVTESKQVSRHHLHVEVDAGVKYRLVANTGPGNQRCTEVQLVMD